MHESGGLFSIQENDGSRDFQYVIECGPSAALRIVGIEKRNVRRDAPFGEFDRHHAFGTGALGAAGFAENENLFVVHA